VHFAPSGQKILVKTEIHAGVKIRLGIRSSRISIVFTIFSLTFVWQRSSLTNAKFGSHRLRFLASVPIGDKRWFFFPGGR